MRTSVACGSAATIASDSDGGVSASSSPTTTSVGTVMAGSSACESGRSIMRTIASRMAAGDWRLMSRRTVSSAPGLCSRVVGPRSFGIMSRATPCGPSCSSTVSIALRAARPSSESAPARVSASTRARTSDGVRRITANAV